MLRSALGSGFGLLLAALFAACGPGACESPAELEVCSWVADEGRCDRPADYAAGVMYRLVVRGRALPRALELVVTEIRGSEAHELRRESIEVPEGGAQVERAFVLPTVGRYRIEARNAGGALLGERTVDVTVETVRPAGR